mgnify:CR=1 FL=1
MKNRCDIDKKYTWDLDVIYSDMNSFDKDYDKAKKLIKKLGSFEKKMIVNSSNFYKTIKLYFDIDRVVTKLSIYTSLSFDLDTSDNSKQELSEKVSNLRSDFSKCSYFIVPSILKLDNKTLKLFYKEEKLLKEYKCYIDEVYRYKKHTLGDNEEKIMSSIGKIIGTCYDTYELFKDCDMSFGNVIDSDGKEIELTNSNYSLFIESKDRKVRESAFNTLYSEYKKYTNTYASLIATNMKELSTLAKIYKYDTAIEMSLFGDDVSIDVYNNLIDSVHEKIGYIYEYYNLKKGILGLDELHLYDIYVPIVGEYDKKYEYEEAKDIIVKVLEVFGDEYVNKVKEGLDSRWIDVYPTKNKRTGGYSGGMYDTYPYILLNYQDKYNDMSTLIHEMGHSMHSYYSRNYNTYQNSEYRIFVAEVASTVNELLLNYYLLNNTNDQEEKKYILSNLMDLFKATLYRQTMFAEYERNMHSKHEKGEILTNELLCNEYYKLNLKYFGPNVVVDELIKYEWERIPHFYYDFYVYKYAIGLSCACYIVDGILNKKEGFLGNYLKFLSSGGSDYPINELKMAGIDVTKKEVIESAIKMFDGLIEQFKDLM